MSLQTSIEIIREAYNEGLPHTQSSLQKFNWKDKGCYMDWLVQTYHYVKHTTRLTALAAARLPIEHTNLHQHMLDHAAEEKGHEQLILNDLNNLLYPVKNINFFELPSTKAFYQTLYYQIDHLSPWALFGRVLPLEGLAAILGNKIAKTVNKTIKHPETQSITSFLDAHADLDPTHVERAFSIVENVSIAEAKIIAEGIELTYSLYETMLKDIKAANK